MGPLNVQGESSRASLSLDLAARSVRIGTNELRLEPRAFDLLVQLVESAGVVCEKRALFESVWAGRVVGDAALTQAIARIRRELSRCDGESEWVRTVHGVGYVFDGPVAIAARGESDRPLTPANRRHWGRASAALIVIAVLIVLSTWMFTPGRSSPRIAIAPFTLEAHAENLEFGKIALPELLGDALEDRSDLGVVGPSQVRRGLANLEWPVDAGDAETARTIRDLFGVDHVLFARLDGKGKDLRLAWQIYGREEEDSRGEVSASGIGEMVRTTSHHVADSLDVAYAVGIPIRKLVSDEFVNEAFARGMQALLSGESTAAERYFDTALQDAPETGWLYYERGNSRTQQGRFDVAAPDYEHALKLASKVGDRNLAGAAETGLGRVDWRAGHLDSASRRFARARDQFEAVGNDANLAAALGNLGILADNRGALEEARELYERALALYRAESDRAGESAVYSNLAVIARKHNRLDNAAELQRKALETQRRYGLRQMTVFSATHLAEIERLRGHWENAGRLLGEASVEAGRADDAIGQADLVAGRAALAREMGDNQAAADHESVALAAYEKLENPAGEMKLRLGRGERLFVLDATAAGHEFKRVVELATSLGDEEARLLAELWLAELGDGDLALAMASIVSRIQTHPSAMLDAQVRHSAARLENTSSGWEAAYETSSHVGGVREQALLALRLARQRIVDGHTNGIEALIGRAETWRPDHPQTLAVRACLSRIEGRLSESAQLERRASSTAGSSGPSGWCPVSFAAAD